ncbi:hypothetical protein [Mucilaginibacter sp. AK015]|uniref:hypothetical protein n=1 Tax=Mucilaginibacter sp. AK015 TaxID=2723072 RepID=UPI0016129FB4|nr:hypothetical protein [Mucilaginibacter sp. AK015]MBB5395064.1 hypothetical protein [Mucilaginibacter sp. AK015]
MKNRLYMILMILAMALIQAFFFNDTKPVDSNPDSKFESNWHSATGEVYIDIGRILVKNNIPCSDMLIRESVANRNEYIVGCRIDTEPWNGYHIWTSSGDILSFNDPKIIMPPK